MADIRLSSTEVVHELVRAKATGRLSVSGADPVIVTGPQADRERARAVLKSRGLTLTSSVDQDEWYRDEDR